MLPPFILVWLERNFEAIVVWRQMTRGFYAPFPLSICKCIVVTSPFFTVKIVMIRLISQACFLLCNKSVPSSIQLMRVVDVKFNVMAKLILAWNGEEDGRLSCGGGDGVNSCVGVDYGSVGCIGRCGGGGDESTGEEVTSFEGVILKGDSSCVDGGMGIFADILVYISSNFIIWLLINFVNFWSAAFL